MAKNDVRIQLGLDVDLRAGQINLDQKTLQQAIGAALRGLNIPAKEIEQKFGVKPEFSPAQLRRAIRRQLDALDTIIEAETDGGPKTKGSLQNVLAEKLGLDVRQLTSTQEKQLRKLAKTAKSQAQAVQQDLTRLYQTLAEQPIDKKIRGKRTQGLIDKVTAESFDLKALQSLTDGQLALLRNVAQRFEQIDAMFRQVRSNADRLGKVGLDGNPLDPRFLDNVEAARRRTKEVATRINEALDEDKLSSRTQRRKREREAEEKVEARVDERRAGRSLLTRTRREDFTGFDAPAETELLQKFLGDRERRLRARLGKAISAGDLRRAETYNQVLGRINRTLEAIDPRKRVDLEVRVHADRLIREGADTGFRNLKAPGQAKEVRRRLLQIESEQSQRLAEAETRGAPQRQKDLLNKGLERTGRLLESVARRTRELGAANKAADRDVNDLTASLQRQRKAAGRQTLQKGFQGGFAQLDEGDARRAKRVLRRRLGRVDQLLEEAQGRGADPARIDALTKAQARYSQALDVTEASLGRYRREKRQAIESTDEFTAAQRRLQNIAGRRALTKGQQFGTEALTGAETRDARTLLEGQEKRLRSRIGDAISSGDLRRVERYRALLERLKRTLDSITPSRGRATAAAEETLAGKRFVRGVVRTGRTTGFENVTERGTADNVRDVLRAQRRTLVRAQARLADRGGLTEKAQTRLTAGLKTIDRDLAKLSDRVKGFSEVTGKATTSTRELTREQRLAAGRNIVRERGVLPAAGGFGDRPSAQAAQDFLQTRLDRVQRRFDREAAKPIDQRNERRVRTLAEAVDKYTRAVAAAKREVRAFGEQNDVAAASLTRLRQRLRTGQQLVAKGADVGFTNLRSQAEADLARDALQNRQNRLQGLFVREAAKPQERQNTQRLRRLSGAMQDVDKALNSLTHRFNEYNKVQYQAGALIRQFFRYAIGYGALYQVLHAVTALTRGLIDLDEALTSIRAVAQTNARELLEIESAIKQIALTTRFNTTEIANAAQVLAQAGVPSDKIRETLTATAQFAAATASTIEVSSDLISTMRTVFSELDSLSIADKLTRAINISKLTADDLKPILSISAQIADSFNLTADQYLAAVTTLRNAGLKSSTVATGLRQGLIEIFNPDSKTLKALKRRYREIGEDLTGEAIKTRFAGFQTEDNPLLASLREIQRIGFLDSRAGQRAFDVRAENAIKALINSIDDLAKDEARLSVGGAAQLGSDIQLQSFRQTLRNLIAAITVFTDSLVGDALPALRDLTAALTDQIANWTKFNDNLKALTGKGIGSGLLAGVATGAGVALTSKGTLGQKAVKGLGAAAATAGVSTGILSATGSPTGGSIVQALTNTALIGPVVATVLNMMRGRMPDFRRRRSLSETFNRSRPAPHRAPSNIKEVSGVAPSRAQGAGARSASRLSKVADVAIVGSSLANLFEIAAGVWKRIKAVPGVKTLGKIFTIGGRVNPITSAVLTLLFLYNLFSSLGDKTKDAKRRLDQSLQNSSSAAADASKLRQQGRDVRFSSEEELAGEGTTAAAVEGLAGDVTALEAGIQQRFGVTSAAIRGELQELAGSGAEVGSQGRIDALSRLADRLEELGRERVAGHVRELAEAQRHLTRAQAAEDRAISNLASGVVDAASGVEAVREELFKRFQQVRDLGDAASEADKAFLASYQEALGEGNFGKLSGSLVADTQELLTLLETILRRADERIQQAHRELRGETISTTDETAEKLGEEALKGTVDESQLQASIAGLIVDYQNFGLTLQEAVARLRENLQKGEEQLKAKQERDRTLFDPITGLPYGRRPEDPDKKLTGPSAVKALDTFEAKAAEERRQTIEQKQTEAETFLDKLLTDLATDAGAARAEAQLKDDPVTAAALEQARALRDSGAALVNEHGVRLEAIRNLEKFAGVVGKSADAQRSREAAIEEAQAEAAETKKITEPVFQVETRNQETQRELARAQDKDIRGERKKLFEREQQEQREILKAQEQALQDRIEQTKADDSIADRARALQPLYEQLDTLARERVQLEERLTDEKRDELEEIERLRTIEDLARDQAEHALDPTGAAFDTADPYARGRILSQDRTETQAREAAVVQDRADHLRRSAELLERKQAELVKTHRDDPEAQEQERLRLQKEIDDLNTQIGELEGRVSELGNTAKDELREGFDFTEIAAQLERVNGGLVEFGENIQQAIVGPLSTLGSQITSAIRAGENLGDVFLRVFNSIANRVTDLAADQLFNTLFSDLFEGLGKKQGDPTLAKGKDKDQGGTQTAGTVPTPADPTTAARTQPVEMRLGDDCIRICDPCCDGEPDKDGTDPFEGFDDPREVKSDEELFGLPPFQRQGGKVFNPHGTRNPLDDVLVDTTQREDRSEEVLGEAIERQGQEVEDAVQAVQDAVQEADRSEDQNSAELLSAIENLQIEALKAGATPEEASLNGRLPRIEMHGPTTPDDLLVDTTQRSSAVFDEVVAANEGTRDAVNSQTSAQPGLFRGLGDKVTGGLRQLGGVFSSFLGPIGSTVRQILGAMTNKSAEAAKFAFQMFKTFIPAKTGGLVAKFAKGGVVREDTPKPIRFAKGGIVEIDEGEAAKFAKGGVVMEDTPKPIRFAKGGVIELDEGEAAKFAHGGTVSVDSESKQSFRERLVERFARGGLIHGPGTGTSDSIPGFILDKQGRPRKPLLVSDGEAILNAKATAALGENLINDINAGRALKFATGGMVKIRKETMSSSRPAAVGAGSHDPAPSDEKANVNVHQTLNITGDVSRKTATHLAFETMRRQQMAARLKG